MLINLSEETPHVGVRIDKKVYQIYANDKTESLIDQVVGHYFEQADKLEKLRSKLEDAENGKAKITEKDITDFSDDIIKSLREKLTTLFDKLLDEKGIGQKLWESKHGSTELLMTDLTTIQNALKHEKSEYEKKRQQMLKEKYPVRNLKPRGNTRK
ncbi:hypothetical protein [Liquorilactobacillus mali]|uniref:Uncharacterized protein n=1 Tax=Liquorilactobacillus mali KCTC 3596 = DSM 20444 TaxID=1046596 RepID=J0KWR4_9LACO|nr:hypothetical protein [Liquorilactobacillus mali]EJE97695.1 hypothetical protein LMA_09355 [Liquorilactobacillus mali KCTC 3596 = DSM 20444]KRN08811.1 hypothetical protein FD00_GL001762 [Liquorilactobacillus mali KCTC 3596 = DSM 20444]QFQ75144.1 hypothetical protein LM596_08515 [Liquorilactobacillus mali]